MKLVSLTIIAFISITCLKAQTLPTTTDSTENTITVFPYTDLLPQEFTSLALENEYYSDSNFVTTADRDYIFILKLRSNYTFIYETYYKPYNRTRVGFYIGHYTIVKNKIHLVFRPFLSGHPDKAYISPALPVSWQLPKRPEYLLVKKSMLLEANKKGRAKKTIYIPGDKLQFNLGTCN